MSSLQSTMITQTKLKKTFVKSMSNHFVLHVGRFLEFIVTLDRTELATIKPCEMQR